MHDSENTSQSFLRTAEFILRLKEDLITLCLKHLSGYAKP
jgi:hypothetical protein